MIYLVGRCQILSPAVNNLRKDLGDLVLSLMWFFLYSMSCYLRDDEAGIIVCVRVHWKQNLVRRVTRLSWVYPTMFVCRSPKQNDADGGGTVRWKIASQ